MYIAPKCTPTERALNDSAAKLYKKQLKKLKSFILTPSDILYCLLKRIDQLLTQLAT